VPTRQLLVTLAASALLSLAACAGPARSGGTVPPPPVYETPPELPAPAAEKKEAAEPQPAAPARVAAAPAIPRLASGGAAGKPAAFVRTAAGSYWLWVDKRGWHLFTTAAKGQHRFQGTVTGLEGPLTAFRPTYLGWKDKVKVDGNRVRFDFETRGRADGFTWKMASGCARFELLFDGQPRVERIHVGKAAVSPPSAVFEACQ
jgi:hypothetical protein